MLKVANGVCDGMVRSQRVVSLFSGGDNGWERTGWLKKRRLGDTEKKKKKIVFNLATSEQDY